MCWMSEYIILWLMCKKWHNKAKVEGAQRTQIPYNENTISTQIPCLISPVMSMGICVPLSMESGIPW